MNTTTPTNTSTPVAPFPEGVARVLSYLANLIDGTIELRGVGIGVREFAASFLQVPLTQVVITSADLAPMAFQLTALAFADDLATHGPVAVIGDDQEEPPLWTSIDLGDETLRIPVQLAAAFAAGTLLPCPVVVAARKDHNDNLSIVVYARTGDGAAAEAYISDLRRRGRDRTNPFRNRTLASHFHPQLGLSFRAATPVAATREDIVLPDAIWRDVDRNVHGLLGAWAQLHAAGLSANRGVLLAGPPGTGKTAICRVLATELAGQATVVFADASSVSHAIGMLYAELRHLSPAVIVLEDVDLVVSHRYHGGGSTLIDFLLALDGAMSTHSGVVTIATTNDVAAIDPAARRASRFDAVIDVPAPDLVGRAAILERYLARVACADDVDVRAVAAATPGCTGADLRELVSEAVLHVEADGGDAYGGTIDAALLLRLARTSRGRSVGSSQYL
jgi:hypothetical protein